MTEHLRIIIPGAPAPWGAYTRYDKSPAKGRLKAYQDHIQLLARQAYGDKEPRQGPVELEICFHCPQKLYDKADVSNMVKAAEDAMKGIVYVDDKQVVDIRGWKEVSVAPATGIWVSLEES